MTHQSASEIDSCLAALEGSNAQVIVVDNASSDHTAAVARVRGVRVIENTENRGFAAAVNQGVLALDTRLVLILNPDAVLRKGLSALVQRLSMPGVGAVGGKLVNADGTPQRGFNVRAFPTPPALIFEILLINRLWRTNPVNWHYRCFDLTLATPQPVDQPAGAFLMFSRAAWQQIGGFDEGYFPVWFEDADFCRRLRDAGYTIWFEPAAEAIHRGGHSVGTLSVEQSRLYWYRSLLKYSARHFSAASYRVVCAALVLGSMVRLIAEAIQHRSFRTSAVYGSIARLGAKCFRGPQYALASGVR